MNFPSNNIFYNYYNNSYNKKIENTKLKNYGIQILNHSNNYYSTNYNNNNNNKINYHNLNNYSNTYYQTNNINKNIYLNDNYNNNYNNNFQLNNFNSHNQTNNSNHFYSYSNNINNNINQNLKYNNNNNIQNNINIQYNNNNNIQYNNNIQNNNINIKNNNNKNSIENKSFNEIWSLFPKYFLFLEHSKFNSVLKELVSTQKNFFLFMYGTNDSNGFSWCLDCDNVKPFINKAKKIVSSREKEKEIYFVSVPIDRDKKLEYKKHPICQMQHVPTLAYFQKGKEINRILEKQMSTQEMVNNFIEMAYKI